MKLLYFLLLLSAVLFGTTNGASQHSPGTTTVVTTTVTTTVTHTVTRTRQPPCPTVRSGVLNFDDLPAATVAPMPPVYHDFDLSSWEYLTPTSFPRSSREFNSASSAPNALLSRGHSATLSTVAARGFSFDITSAALFAFAPGDGATLLAEVRLRAADGYTDVRFFDVPNGARAQLAELGAYTDLVEVEVAVWASYEQGVAAQFVLDDIEYVRRECAPA